MFKIYNNGNTTMNENFVDKYYSSGYLTYTSTSTNNNTWNDNIWDNQYNYYTSNATVTSRYINGSSEIYDAVFRWTYSEDVTGIREFMFTNNLYHEIGYTLYQMYIDSEKDDQEFEYDLYGLTLDLLYERLKTEEDNTFEDFFNEKKYSYVGVNAIISEIIDSYHKIKSKSEDFYE